MDRDGHLGAMEMAVLATLARLEEAYGVTLHREIEARTGREVSLGAVYATLRRLEAAGHVSSRLGDPTPERGGRAKKYFRIEAPGEAALKRTRRLVLRLFRDLPELSG